MINWVTVAIWYRRRRCISRMPTRDECRRSDVHSLHIRIDRKPKGVLYTTGGHMVYDNDTHVFDYRWRYLLVYGDVGWVTGHSYILYGPLAVVPLR